MISYSVIPCDRAFIKDFIEHWHYSHNINGVISDYCFALMDNDKLIGGAIFGKLAMANQWKKYVDQQEKIIELRRLCCIDETPRNTESFFISRCIKWLLQNTEIELIISYADMTYGHSGIIYQASNFTHVGMTASGRMISFEEKLYHDKTIRTKYNGKLKPYAQRIKDALEDGRAQYIKTKSKHIYTYSLSSRRKRKKESIN